MWHLKYRFAHSDCIYAPKLKELGLSVQFHHLGRYEEDGKICTTALQKLSGDDDTIKAYHTYLKDHSSIERVERPTRLTLITLAKQPEKSMLYKSSYNSIFIRPSPAYIEESGHEVHELACWDREPLEQHIKVLKENPTTTHFDLLAFEQDDLSDIYAVSLLPNLPEKQQGAIQLAVDNGYYQTPHETTLAELSDQAGISKATFQEHLRKAEEKLLPRLVSDDG